MLMPRVQNFTLISLIIYFVCACSSNNKTEIVFKGEVPVKKFNAVPYDGNKVIIDPDKESILQAILKNESKFKNCSQKYTQNKSPETKKIVIQWSILNQKATEIKTILNTTQKNELTKCLKQILATFTFPYYGNNIKPVVTYPFYFTTQ